MSLRPILHTRGRPEKKSRDRQCNIGDARVSIILISPLETNEKVVSPRSYHFFSRHQAKLLVCRERKKRFSEIKNISVVNKTVAFLLFPTVRIYKLSIHPRAPRYINIFSAAAERDIDVRDIETRGNGWRPVRGYIRC